MSHLRLRPGILAFLLLSCGFYYADLYWMRSLEIRPDLVNLSLLSDLCLCVPGLYWWFVVRAQSGPRAGVLWLMYLGLIVTYRLGPDNPVLEWIVANYPALVFSLGGSLVILSVGRLVRAYFGSHGLNPEQRISAMAARAAFSPAALRLIESELRIWYYAVCGWRATPPLATDTQQHFSYHRRSATKSLLIGMALFSVPEIPLFHIVLAHFNTGLAWLVSVLSAYGLLLGPAQAFAMVLRPLCLDTELLQLRYGLIWQLQLRLEDIDEIKALDASYVAPKDKTCLRGGLMGQANVLIQFRRELTADLLYGLRRKVRSAALYVDEPQALIRAVIAAQQTAEAHAFTTTETLSNR